MTPRVACLAAGDGWRCTVTVGDDADATIHDVTVNQATREDLAPEATVDELVAASFAFLLEREPREAIMRRFELPVIGRYFPDYAEVIRGRLRE